MNSNIKVYRIFFVLFFLYNLSLTSCDTAASTTEASKLKASVDNIVKDSISLEEEEQLELAPDEAFSYQLNEPDATFKMPNKLKEISGLGINEAGTYLYAIQDEEGDLFMINTSTGEVEEEINFHKDGDYEGVECAAGRIFIVKSSGTLYEVKNLGTDNQELIKNKFTFNKNSDVEGLGYDPIENRLLISCKGKAGKGDEYEFKKGIFSLDMDSMQLDLNPVYTISVEEVKSFLEVNNTLEKIDKLIKLFQPGEEFIFGPSGIAVHPRTNDIYIISSVGKVIVVLNRLGKIKHIIKLKKKIHQQPEGIAFDQDGTLYIANEGKDDKGKIYKFAYLP